MTDRQFAAALRRHGMKPAGFLGYIEIPAPPGATYSMRSVSMLNAGTLNKRAILAFLLREKDAMEREAAKNEVAP